MRQCLGRVLLVLVGSGLAGLLLVASALYAHDAWIGVNRPYEPFQRPHPAFPELGLEWRMHPVDNPGDWLPNGLDAGDVDGDGDEDYLTNYEFQGRLRVALYPGPDAATKGTFWPAVDAGRIANAENAAFGDLDGDGHLDIVVAHGWNTLGALPVWPSCGEQPGRAGMMPATCPPVWTGATG